MLKFFYIDISHSPQCITRSLTKTRMCVCGQGQWVLGFFLFWVGFIIFLKEEYFMCCRERLDFCQKKQLKHNRVKKKKKKSMQSKHYFHVGM